MVLHASTPSAEGATDPRMSFDRVLKRRDFMKLGAGAMSLGLLSPLGWFADQLAEPEKAERTPPTDPGNSNRGTPVVAQPAEHLQRVPTSASRPSGIQPPSHSTSAWELDWVDDFTEDDLEYPRWGRYDGSPRAGLHWRPSHVTQAGSEVVFESYQDPAYGNEWVSGGMSTPPAMAQTYGKYEVCYRIERGVGVSHCLLLWPVWPLSGPPEIDFAEDNGHSREWVQGTLHWRPDEGVETVEDRTVLDIDTTDWHVLGVEWSPELIQFTVDGAVWKTIRGRAVPSSPLRLCLQTQTLGRGSGWEAPDPENGTRVEMHVDWVAVYSHRT